MLGVVGPARGFVQEEEGVEGGVIIDGVPVRGAEGCIRIGFAYIDR